jgi:ferredoxin
VLPSELDRLPNLGIWTRIELPFNNPKKHPDKALSTGSGTGNDASVLRMIRLVRPQLLEQFVVHDRPAALADWRVMEVIRDWEIDIKANYGGACACAGCHVYVEEPWIAHLHRPTVEEEDRLDEAFQVQTTSRLCGQNVELLWEQTGRTRR